MRENRPYSSEGGEAKSLPYPYRGWFDFNFQTAKTYFAFPRRDAPKLCASIPRP